MKKVGIISGTFDPIHDGHVAFAREAQKSFGLDKIFFLVEPRPRRKQGVKAFEHRVNMVELALKKEKNLGTILLKQPRFTVKETMPLLRERFKGAEMYFLMGEDFLDHLTSWPNIAELVDAVYVIIATRHKAIPDVKKQLTVIKQTTGLHLKADVFEAEQSAVSSSQVRSAIKHGRQPSGLNPSVQAYIKANGLYSATDK